MAMHVLRTVGSVSILFLSGIVLAQEQQLFPCCENGQAEGIRADQYTSATPWPGCNPPEVEILARECVDRTKLHHICGDGTGSRFCKETNSAYPRYYALDHPIASSATNLTFFAVKGGQNPPAQTMSLANDVFVQLLVLDDEVMPWAASSSQPWLIISPSNGQIQGGTPDTVTASVNVSGLGAGAYSGLITISSSKVSDYQRTYVSVQLSVYGATISGPTYLNRYQNGTWNATALGGITPYHYQWYYRYPQTIVEEDGGPPMPLKPPRGVWYKLGSDSPQLTRSDDEDFQLKCEVTDAHPVTVTSNILYVSVGGVLKPTASQNESRQAVEYNLADKVAILQAPSPNPFNPSTTISFTLPEAADVRLSIFDVLGREIAILSQGTFEAGYHSATWNASNVASGVYFARLTVTNEYGTVKFTKVNKLLLMK